MSERADETLLGGTWNICYSRQNTGEHEAFALAKRYPKIVALIKSQRLNIICLQEVHERAKSWIEEDFADYRPFWLQHSSRGCCCWNVILVKKGTFPSETTVITSYPTFQNEYKGKVETISCITMVEFVGHLTIVNVHAPMAKDLRFRASEILHNLAPCCDKGVVMGDFNAFSDGNGPEQLQIIVDGGWVHAKNNQLTFRAYPYDKFESDVPPMPLDHVFTKGMNVTGLEVTGGHPGPENITVDDWDEPYFISDHFFLTFKLTNVQ